MGPQVICRGAAGKLDVNSRLHAPTHGHEMRGEADSDL